MNGEWWVGIIEVDCLFLSLVVARYGSEYLRYDRSNYSILAGCSDRQLSQCRSLSRSGWAVDFVAAIALSEVLSSIGDGRKYPDLGLVIIAGQMSSLPHADFTPLSADWSNHGDHFCAGLQSLWAVNSDSWLFVADVLVVGTDIDRFGYNDTTQPDYSIWTGIRISFSSYSGLFGSAGNSGS